MFKNKIAVKLSLYFASALFLFSIIIGISFMLLLRNNTIRIHENQLSERAESMASTLSKYMDGYSGMGGSSMGGNGMGGNGMGGNGMGGGMGSGYGAYFQFLSDIAGTDVWVVDRNLNLVTSGMGHGMGRRHDYTYSDLPENAEMLIIDVFTGKTLLSEEFSGLFAESTLTVGAPIINPNNDVIGVVLLHSPISGIDEAITQGGRLLAISLGIALPSAFLLSLWLSKNFTDPIISKEARDALRLEHTRREFVANISHELKTPVTVIRASLEALVDKVATDPTQIEDYHNQMLCEATFLQRLIGDLLDLSKLQNMDFVIEKQDISLCDIVDDITRSVRHIAVKKGIELNIVKNDTDCIINGDYGRIRQMLMVILDNAVKFSPEKGTVDIIHKNRTLSIRDYGIGISKADLPFIFDRFYKTNSEQNKTGTGLGLAIAKQIAERHNIELSVQSNEGAGAEFIFQMP
ncbi:sensor histidine kinase [Clostridium sp. UBA6640]|uniref:sensor histidine kinase n=1 Tax=Clostridium sp. UBA6640 TaxID=1946370 RepID=UPI0025B9F1D3|nr:HAMP domain-containing sensor histidine kinase [Clostridium sp. UBA6640]